MAVLLHSEVAVLQLFVRGRWHLSDVMACMLKALLFAGVGYNAASFFVVGTYVSEASVEATSSLLESFVFLRHDLFCWM